MISVSILMSFTREWQFLRSWGAKAYTHTSIDSWENFEETRLPPKNAFYSKLNMKGIGDKDYEHAEEVWNRITPKMLPWEITMTFL